MNPRLFPDISNYTARFEAQHVATAGALLVGILATDGLDFTSPKHGEQADEAHAAGLAVWHYHFARPERNPRGAGEAGRFWQVARPHYRPGDSLVIDLERPHPAGPAALVAYFLHLDRMLHHVSGVHEIPYMPDALFRACGPGLQPLGRRFWIASWGGTVRKLGAGRELVAQQISNGAEGSRPFTYPGIGACDTNMLTRPYYRLLAQQRRSRARARARAC